MNITMNSAPLPAGNDAPTAGAAIAGAAPADALPLDPALAAAQGGPPAAMPFLQFMGVDMDVESNLEAPALPAGELPVSDPDAAALQQQAAAPAPATAAAAEPAPNAGNAAVMAALAMPMMPLMPSMMMTMPAALRAPSGKPQQAADAAAVLGAGTGAAGAGAAGSIELPLAAAMRQAPDGAALAPGADSAYAQLARAGQAATPAAPAQAAASSQPPAAGMPSQAQGRDSAVPEGGAPSAGTHAGFGVAAPAAAGVTARDGTTLALSGPPTAWRQSLQEALGERLNLQLGKNAEQATIRLEPPMLGRVEISIRHIAGALEVNITATHSEVLRQLNTVSDNLRSDLAGRQYTDVSVNISQAPRAQASAQAGAGFGAGADAQGRGREQEQDQDQEKRAPGAALAEAHHTNSAFSLSGRA